MRILANYGYKTNGDSYMVSFETSGDVPKEQGDSVVDELFSMARRAIERQINPTEPHKDEVVIPEVKKPAGGNGKPHPKDTGAPISPKQKTLIIKLSKQRKRVIDGLNEMSMAEASSTIKELLAVEA